MRLNVNQEHCLKGTGCLDLNAATKVGTYDWKTIVEYLGAGTTLPASASISTLDLCSATSTLCCAYQQVVTAVSNANDSTYTTDQKCIVKNTTGTNLLVGPFTS